MIKMFRVFKVDSNGNLQPVSKSFPTWLGCKRFRNRIVRNSPSDGSRYVIYPVFSN